MISKQKGFGFVQVMLLFLIILGGAAYWKYEKREEARLANSPEAIAKKKEEEMRRNEKERADAVAAQKSAFDKRALENKKLAPSDKAVASVKAIHDQWVDAFNLALNTSRVNLPDQIAKLQALSRELDLIDVPDCYKDPKEALTRGMKMGIEGFMEFLSSPKNEAVSRSQVRSSMEFIKIFQSASGACDNSNKNKSAPN